jgi:hypothetical protein
LYKDIFVVDTSYLSGELPTHITLKIKKAILNMNSFFLVGDDPDLSGELPTHITLKIKKAILNMNSFFLVGDERLELPTLWV